MLVLNTLSNNIRPVYKLTTKKHNESGCGLDYVLIEQTSFNGCACAVHHNRAHAQCPQKTLLSVREFVIFHAAFVRIVSLCGSLSKSLFLVHFHCI